MKRIGIDARLINQTGVGVYLRNLFYHLETIAPSEYEFYIYLLSDDAREISFKHKNFVKRIANFRWHSLGEQFGFLHELEKDKLDLMHFTYFSYPVWYRSKFIATIHDLTPLLFKTGKASAQNQLLYQTKHFFLQYVLRQQIHNAKHIITPVETIRKQIIELYGRQYEGKITSLYEGVNYELKMPREHTDLSAQFKKPFFIYVGNFYPHKNVERLIKSFVTINSDVQLILIGPRDYFATRVKDLIEKLGLTHKVIFYQKVSNSELVFFYKHAQALIHPSLSEGFGLPLIEAAYFNLPIIASNIAVFQELLGNSYVAFDPLRWEDIAAKIKQFLRTKHKVNYDTFLSKCSFKTMTEKTLELYTSFL